jgi:hypothetical protein
MASRPVTGSSTSAAGAYPLTSCNPPSTASNFDPNVDPYSYSNAGLYHGSNGSTNGHAVSTSGSASNVNSYASSTNTPNAVPNSSPRMPNGIPVHWSSALTSASNAFWQAWSKYIRGPLQQPIVFLKWVCTGIKTVCLSYGKVTIFLGMVLATIYSIPAWQGYRLQVWTSQKDYVEYCNDELVCCKARKSYLVV